MPNPWRSPRLMRRVRQYAGKMEPVRLTPEEFRRHVVLVNRMRVEPDRPVREIRAELGILEDGRFGKES